MAKKREEIAKSESIAVSLSYVFPPDLAVGLFANHTLVQRDEHSFHLSFFQVTPPVILGTESERHEIAAKLGSIPAKCVARVVVAEGYVQSLIDALQASLVQAKQKTDKANGQDRSHDKTA